MFVFVAKLLYLAVAASCLQIVENIHTLAHHLESDSWAVAFKSMNLECEHLPHLANILKNEDYEFYEFFTHHQNILEIGRRALDCGLPIEMLNQLVVLDVFQIHEKEFLLHAMESNNTAPLFGTRCFKPMAFTNVFELFLIALHICDYQLELIESMHTWSVYLFQKLNIEQIIKVWVLFDAECISQVPAIQYLEKIQMLLKELKESNAVEMQLRFIHICESLSLFLGCSEHEMEVGAIDARDLLSGDGDNPVDATKAFVYWEHYIFCVKHEKEITLNADDLIAISTPCPYHWKTIQKYGALPLLDLFLRKYCLRMSPKYLKNKFKSREQIISMDRKSLFIFDTIEYARQWTIKNSNMESILNPPTLVVHHITTSFYKSIFVESMRKANIKAGNGRFFVIPCNHGPDSNTLLLFRLLRLLILLHEIDYGIDFMCDKDDCSALCHREDYVMMRDGVVFELLD